MDFVQNLQEKTDWVETPRLRATAKSEQVWREVLSLCIFWNSSGVFRDRLLENSLNSKTPDVYYHKLTNKHRSNYD